MNIDGGCCIVALALTVNCITSLVDGALKITRHYEGKGKDFYSIEKFYDFLENSFSSILKRAMFLECIACLVLSFLFCPDHLIMLKNKIWLLWLFLPQIILIFYCLVMETILIYRMAYLDSIKYDIPSYQCCIECIFKLVRYSLVYILAPIKFNKICQRIFEEITEKHMKVEKTMNTENMGSENIRNKLQVQRKIKSTSDDNKQK